LVRIYRLCAAVIGMLVTGSAHAAENCAALKEAATPSTRAADAALVKRLDPGQSVTAGDVGTVMVEGPWRLVWATPKNAERGVYFFRRGEDGSYQLAETWGGVMLPDERQDGIKWTTEIKGGGPSQQLAGCFADAVIAGE
jgi:hypothetical protein